MSQPIEPVNVRKPGSCYSRRLEEVFTEDYPKEGKDVRTVENEKDKRAPEQKALRHGQSSDGAASDSLAADVSRPAKSVQDGQVERA